MAKEALEDYRVMLAAASANLVQVELGVMQALAAGTATTGTGFYASAGGQHSNDLISFSNEKTWQGSSLSASAMSINADKANIIDSDINAGLLGQCDILISAGTNEQAAVTNKKPRLPASVSVAAGWVAGMPMSVLMKRTPKVRLPVRQ